MGRKLLGETNGDLRLIEHLPYCSAVNDEIVMLHDGDVMRSFTVEGIAAQTAEQDDVDDVAQAGAKVVTQLSPDVAIYVHRISTRDTAVTGPGLEPDTLAGVVDENWRAYLATRNLMARQVMVSVVVRPWRLKRFWSRAVSGGQKKLKADRDARAVRLEEQISYLMDACQKARPTRMRLSGGTWLGLLGMAVSGGFYKAEAGLRLGS